MPEKSRRPEKPRRSKLGRFIFILIVAVVAAIGVQLFIPLPDLSDSTFRVSSATVEVRREGKDIYFLPRDYVSDKPGFIFYPGARVPKEAYSYLGRSLAEAGYPAALLDLPLKYAIFQPMAADRPIQAHPEVAAWVVGGHSLGGTMAAAYMAKRTDQGRLAGIVFLASYPPDFASLAANPAPALCISASNDMLVDEESLAKRAELFPESTIRLVIAGGNHAQFGSYGPQRGDGAADIPPSRQHQEVVDSVLAFLANLQ